MAEQLAVEVDVKNVTEDRTQTHGQAPLFGLGFQKQLKKHVRKKVAK